MATRMDPETAARWMRERVLKKGELQQTEAATHLLQFGDPRLAYYNHDESACVGRLVLSRFGKSSPDIKYDRRAKAWRKT